MKISRVIVGSVLLALASGVFVRAQEPGNVNEVPTDALREARVITIGGRALRDAVVSLSQQLNCTITYEDPLRLHPDATVAAFPGGFSLPRTRSVEFSYAVSESDDPAKVIQSLLEKYRSSDNTVGFKVVPTKINPRMFNVVPDVEKNEQGKEAPYNSLLNAKVTVEITDTYWNLLNHICQQASTTGGYQIVADRAPIRAFMNQKATLKGDNIAARACLNALFNSYNTKEKPSLTWSLSIQPDEKLAVINILPVKSIEEAEVPATNLTVESPRPLADAVQVLEKRLSSGTIYEDPPYVCPCQVFRNKANEPQSPSGGVFSVSFPAATKPFERLKTSVDSYNNTNTGKFAVQSVGEAFYVHPTEFMAENFQLAPLKPVLKTPISLSIQQQPVTEVLKTFCARLTAESKSKVSVGVLPPTADLHKPISYSGTATPAFEVLNALSKDINGDVSWQLLYEPRLKGYTLNAHIVQRG